MPARRFRMAPLARILKEPVKEPACQSETDDENGIRCLRQMFPQNDEDYLKEIFSGSLDLPDAIDEVLKSEKEQG